MCVYLCGAVPVVALAPIRFVMGHGDTVSRTYGYAAHADARRTATGRGDAITRHDTCTTRTSVRSVHSEPVMCVDRLECV